MWPLRHKLVKSMAPAPTPPRDNLRLTVVVSALNFPPSDTNPRTAKSLASMVLRVVEWFTRVMDKWGTLPTPTTLTLHTRPDPSTSNVSKKKTYEHQSMPRHLFLCQDLRSLSFMELLDFFLPSPTASVHTVHPRPLPSQDWLADNLAHSP